MGESSIRGDGEMNDIVEKNEETNLELTGREIPPAKEIHEEDRVLSKDQRRQAVELFNSFLHREGFRSTSERFKVLEAVLDMKGHFNADELYATMVLNKSRTSRATVYSTLELLENAAIIFRHNFRSDCNYYEVRFDEPHHDHLICVSCGHISEFVHPELMEIRKQVASTAGLAVVDHSFQVFAECDSPSDCPHNQ